MHSLPNDPGSKESGATTVDPQGRAAARPVAVLDMGSSSIRLLVAEAPPGQPIRLLEEASRGVLLGRETFTSGRIGAATMQAAMSNAPVSRCWSD